MRKQVAGIQALEGFFLILILILTAGSAPGQSLNSLGGGSNQDGALKDLKIDANIEEVVENAISSYKSESNDLIDELLKQKDAQSQEKREMLEAAADKTFVEVEKDIRKELNHLRGDGALTLGETTEELGILRDQKINQLEEILRAAYEGQKPPPTRDDFDTIFNYSGALLSYALLERNSAQDWVLFILLIAGAIATGFIFSRVTRKFAMKTRGRVKDALGDFFNGIRHPVILVLLTIAISVGLNWLWIPVELRTFTKYTVGFLFMASLFWALWNVCDVAGDQLSSTTRNVESEFDEQVAEVASKVLRLIFVFLFVIFTSEVVFDTNLKATFAGVGILGLAITLAAQGTLKNLVGTFTIHGDKPFRVGDFVKYKGYSGPVERIGFRSTKLRTWDGHLITIPNSEIATCDVENVDARPYIRRRTRLDLEYSTSPEKLKQALEIIEDVLSSADGRPNDPEHHVVFEDFGPHSLKILIQYYFTPADYWKALENDQKVNFSILEQFRKNNIHFAFPTQKLFLDTEEDSNLRFQDNNSAQKPTPKVSERVGSEENVQENEAGEDGDAEE